MTRKIVIRTDEYGHLLGVPYEEARLDSFHITRNGLHFAVRARDQSLIDLVMHNMVSLSTEPLWEAIIISELHVWKAFEAPLPIWQALERGRGTDDSLTGILTRYFPQFSDFYVVHVESSYGGGFTCLCQKVEISHRPNDGEH